MCSSLDRETVLVSSITDRLEPVINLLRDSWSVAEIFGPKLNVCLQKGPHHYTRLVRKEDMAATLGSEPLPHSSSLICRP